MMIALLSVCLAGASASVEDSFVVSVPLDRLGVWISRHSETIARAAGSQVIWRNGRQFRIRKQTPRGTVEATVQDDIHRIPNGYRYECRLVPGSSDSLREYRLDCRLTALDSTHTQLTIRVYADAALRVRDAQLERSMSSSLQAVRETLISLAGNN